MPTLHSSISTSQLGPEKREGGRRGGGEEGRGEEGRRGGGIRCECNHETVCVCVCVCVCALTIKAGQTATGTRGVTETTILAGRFAHSWWGKHKLTMQQQRGWLYSQTLTSAVSIRVFVKASVAGAQEAAWGVLTAAVLRANSAQETLIVVCECEGVRE